MTDRLPRSLHLRSFPTYPLSHRETLQREEPHVRIKTLHVVRHAEGHHNVSQDIRNLENLDARLTQRGKEQCAQLDEWCRQSKEKDILQRTELVVTSPLSRCVQTSMLCFPTLFSNTNVPFVAHEDIRETVNYACDRRRHLSHIRKDFPAIDYSLIEHDHDAIWQHYHDKLGDTNKHNLHRESSQLYKVAERGRRFMEWVEQRPEQEIVLCSHAAFLRCLKNFGHQGGIPSMLPQFMDDRSESSVDVPVFQYCGDDFDFERYMRRSYKNCELRSFLVVFEDTDEH